MANRLIEPQPALPETILPVRSVSHYRHWWLHLLLLLLTVFSTTQFGAALYRSFYQGRVLDEDSLSWSYRLIVEAVLPGHRLNSPQFWAGVSYSLPLLCILLAHELGHYVQCRRWQVRATLPYFGPSPTLLGTIGAFIWIRSPIYTRKSLFDIGVWGPISGFVLLLPVLITGVAMSKVSANSADSLLTFGTPLAMRAVEAVFFPGVPVHRIVLHPTAVAAWAGLLATSINLLPVGQLDGAHILYAALGARWHEITSRLVLVALIGAGFIYWPWWLWAVGLFFFRRHPAIYDPEPIDVNRRWLCAVAALLLVICFVPVPIRVT